MESANKQKRTRRTPAQMAEAARGDDQNVLILVGNVWGRDCKFLQYDVVTVDAEIAELFIKNKQGRATNDDATVDVDRDVRPFTRVVL